MSQKIEFVSCPICGKAEFSDFVVSNGYQVVQCRNCGLYYVNPRPAQEDVSRHFRDEYIADIKRVEVDFISFREESLRREAEKIKGLMPQGGRLLDIGTASGAFLTHFSADPLWQAEGVEPNGLAARYAREQLGLKVYDGFLKDQHFPSESYDMITSLDTFYFHPHPNEDMKEIARILKPEGLLAIEIPGLTFRLLKNTGLLCQLIYGLPAKLNAGVHLYYYSGKTLSLLAEKHGFKLIASFPERSPVYGHLIFQWLGKAYYIFSSLCYYLTGGRINIVPKEFLIFGKR